MKHKIIRNSKGKCHNENGPAFIGYFENGNISYEYYYKNNKCHNENGPAVIEYYKNGDIRYEEYYINGFDVTKILLKWHKENNTPINKPTKEELILRKLQIGI